MPDDDQVANLDRMFASEPFAPPVAAGWDSSGGSGPGYAAPGASMPSYPSIRVPAVGIVRALVERLRTDVARTGDLVSADHLWLARRWLPRLAVVGLLLALVSTGWVRWFATAIGVVAALGLGGALGLTWWRLGARRWWVLGGAQRRADLAQLYADALVDSTADGLALLRVRRVHRTGPQGTQCLVAMAGGGSRQAWFWHARPRRGAVLLVRTQPANAKETTRLHLLYVGSEVTGTGVVRRLPRAAWRIGHAHVARRTGAG